MDFSASITGPSAIEIPAIFAFAQIYRFDLVRVVVRDGNQLFEFDIPSTEWLEYYTEVLRCRHPRDWRLTLPASGLWFEVARGDNGIDLRIFNVISSSHVRIELNLDEAIRLHNTLLTFFIDSFLRQGGQLESLKDLQSFRLG